MKRFVVYFTFFFLFIFSLQKLHADALPLPPAGMTSEEYVKSLAYNRIQGFVVCLWVEQEYTVYADPVPPDDHAFAAELVYNKGKWYDPDKSSFIVKRDENNKYLRFIPSILNPFDTLDIITVFYKWWGSSNNIKNGDFESGNTDFYSDYQYVTPNSGGLSQENKYTVSNGLQGNHPTKNSCNADHTSFNGKFFMANGGSENNVIVWQQEVSTRFSSSSYNNYAFSARVLNWSGEDPVGLQWYVDGEPIGTFEYADKEQCNWKRIGAMWKNEKNKQTIVLSLRTTQTSASGNDFGLDDLRFGQIVRRTYDGYARIYFGEKYEDPEFVEISLCQADAPTVYDIAKYIEDNLGLDLLSLEYDNSTVRKALANGGQMLFCHFQKKSYRRPWNTCSNKIYDKCVLVNYSVAPKDFQEYDLDLCLGSSIACPWESSKYKYFIAGGTYLDTIKSVKGCDSLYYKAEVKVISPKQISLDTVVCWKSVTGVYWQDVKHNEFIWDLGNGSSYYMSLPPLFASELYEWSDQKVLKSKSGCDSVIYYLHARWDTEAKSFSEKLYLCPNEELFYPVDTGYFKIITAGTYIINLPSSMSANCSKVWELNVSNYLQDVERPEIDTIFCPGDSYVWYPYGQFHSSKRSFAFTDIRSSSDYYDTLRSVGGCDSVISHLRLNVVYPRDTVIYDTVCRGALPKYYDFGGESLLVNQLRSDSVHNYTQIVHSSRGSSYDCAGLRFHLHLHVNETFTEERDSVVVFGRVVNWVPNSSYPALYDIFRMNTGSDQRVLCLPYSSGVCDSIRYVLNIRSYAEAVIRDDKATICDGASYSWHRADYVSDRILSPDYYGPFLRYTDRLEFMDTIRYVRDPIDSAYYHLVLTIQQVEDKPTVYDTICEDALPYLWNLDYKVISISSASSELDYYDTLRSSYGCDSIRSHLHLVVQKTKSDEDEVVLCHKDTSYKWTTWREQTLKPKFGWNTYYDTSRTSRGCDDTYYTLRIYRRECKDNETSITLCHNSGVYKWYTKDKSMPIFIPVPTKDTTYEDYLSYSDGQCDSVRYVLHIKLIQPETKVQYDTVCGSAPYEWVTSNRNYPKLIHPTTSDTTYRDTLFASSGCDSIYYVLHLKSYIVSPRAPKYDTLCGKGPYLWDQGDGRPLKEIYPIEQTRTYIDTLRYSTGKKCDSVYYTLHLCRLLTKEEYKLDTLCSNVPVYHWYSDGDVYLDRIEPVVGTHSYEKILPYSFTGLCDSVHCYLDLTKYDVTYDTTYDTICNKDSYEWGRVGYLTYEKIRDIVQTTPYEIYYDTLRYTNGCDSIVSILHLTRLMPRFEELSARLCESETYDWYTSDKSVVHLNVGSHTQVSSDTTYMHRISYYHSSCDSVVYRLNVHIDFAKDSVVRDTILLGQSYEWKTKNSISTKLTPPSVGLQEYTDKAYYSDSKRCDSVRYQLYLLVQKDSVVDLTDSVCAGSVYPWTTYTGHTQDITLDADFGDYYDTVFHAGSKRLDSIRYHLHLVRLNYRNVFDTIVLCSDERYTWEYDKNAHKTLFVDAPTASFSRDYWEEKTAVIPYTNRYGCDSVRCTLAILRHAPVDERAVVYRRVCVVDTPFIWQPYTKSFTLSKSGNYSDTARYAVGNCDSVIYRLHLDVIKPTIYTLDTFACDGNDLRWYDPYTKETRSWSNITSPISDTVRLKTFDNCDSIWSVVHINPIKTGETKYPDTTLCYGDVFIWRTWRTQEFPLDDSYYPEHTFTDEAPNNLGCAGMTYSITVTVDKPEKKHFVDTVCVSDLPYVWQPSDKDPSRTQNLSTSGHYTEVFTNVRGCDSMIYELDLEVRALTTEELYDTLCSDATSYNWMTKSGILIKSVTIPLDKMEYTESAMFQYKTGSDKYRCDSITYKLHLHRLQTTKRPMEDYLCNSTTYAWFVDGVLLQRITQTELEKTHTYSIPYVNHPSCDSIIYELTLHRLVTDTVPMTHILCNEDHYDWYYNSKEPSKFIPIQQQVPVNDYTHFEPFMRQLSCDSVIYKLHLIRVEPSEQVSSKTLCDDDTYDWYTSDLTTPRYVIKSSDVLANDTTYRDTLNSSLYPTCGSVYYVLNVHFARRTPYQQKDTVGIDSLYRWYTNDPMTPSRNIASSEAGLKTYYSSVYDANGCEIGHYTLELLCQDYTVDTLMDTVCLGQEYEWTTKDANNPIIIKQTELEKYYYDTAFHAGTKRIDSVHYVLHLVCQSPRVVKDTAYVCGDDTYYWNVADEQIPIHQTEPEDTHRKVLHYSGSKGCDSVRYYLHLIRQDYVPQIKYDTICFGSVYQWKTDEGELLRTINQKAQTGEYHAVAKYSNGTGCDSVRYTLHLHVDTVRYELKEATFCEGETYRWLDNNDNLLREINQTIDAQYHSAISFYRNGCDSIYHTLHLTRLYPSDSITNKVICYGESFNWYDKDYFTTTIETKHIDNSVGCDSLCVLNLTVCAEATTKNLDTIICPNHIVEWHGKILSSTGIYRDTLRNKYGCDSIIYVMNAVEQDTTNSITPAVICYQDLPYLWHHRYCYESGIYTDTLLNAQGCDSICYLDLSVSEAIDYCISDTLLCVDQTLEWRGIEIAEVGVYRDTVFNVLGCDSVYYILNVDTIDCCIHLRNLRLVPLDYVCSDDSLFHYIFQYSSGLPDSFSVVFDSRGVSEGFVNSTGRFAFDNVFDTMSLLPINMPREPYALPFGYRVYIDITDTCGTEYHFTDSLHVYYSRKIVDQHWNDVLAVFNSEYNGGFEFSSYQWYRDNEPIFGAMRDHYYFPANLSTTAEYCVLLTRVNDGYATFTCPVTIFPVSDESVLKDQYIYVHPAIVPKEDPKVQIISNLNGNYWIYDMAGKMLSSGGFKSYDETKAATLVTLPAIQSAYFIYLVPDEKRVIKDRSYIVLVR